MIGAETFHFGCLNGLVPERVIDLSDYRYASSTEGVLVHVSSWIAFDKWSTSAW